MTVVAQAAQQGVHHQPIAEKAVPGIVLKVRGDNRGMPATALFHQLEEDIGLLRPDIDVPRERVRKLGCAAFRAPRGRLRGGEPQALLAHRRGAPTSRCPRATFPTSRTRSWVGRVWNPPKRTMIPR